MHAQMGRALIGRFLAGLSWICLDVYINVHININHLNLHPNLSNPDFIFLSNRTIFQTTFIFEKMHI